MTSYSRRRKEEINLYRKTSLIWKNTMEQWTKVKTPRYRWYPTIKPFKPNEHIQKWKDRCKIDEAIWARAIETLPLEGI